MNRIIPVHMLKARYALIRPVGAYYSWGCGKIEIEIERGIVKHRSEPFKLMLLHETGSFLFMSRKLNSMKLNYRKPNSRKLPPGNSTPGN